jgi:FixJ family two-component response regulator
MNGLSLALGPIDNRLPRLIVRRMAKAPRWIAIVDDDPSVLNALARLLRTRGLESRTFTSAREFLTALSDGLPECLIVDLQMPEMDGLELHRRLTLSGVRIPAIVITAHNEPDARERCAAAGAFAFLAKPLQDTSLFAAIDGARNSARMQGRLPWNDDDKD